MKTFKLIPDKELFNQYKLMYLTLCYLSFYVAYCVFWPLSVTEQYFAWIAIVTFLFCFLHIFHAKASQRWIYIIPVFIIGLICSSYNFWGGIFLLYSAIMLGLVVQTRLLISMYVLSMILIAIELYILEYHWVAIVLILIEMTLFTVVSKYRASANMDYFNLQQQQKSIEYLSTLVERERISRDLHDLIGHSLSMIVMKSELAVRLSPSAPEKCKSEIIDICDIAETAKSDVESAISGYRSRGLDNEITNGKEMLSSAGMSTFTHIKKVAVSSRQEASLSLIYREIVTNIIRHAKASDVRIFMFSNGKYIVLRVEDNGIGIGNSQGSGIAGIRHRVTECNGKLFINGKPGTIIEARLPH
ncbi:sensor histidine kinase [Photobacterium kasasachensis]|uniref:sensor histidine kinase n=1 Tax=Photobacterium kasasachensis TaxID=2910240 RepID=UPI003D0E3157